jgi:hypothetical protein
LIFCHKPAVACDISAEDSGRFASKAFLSHRGATGIYTLKESWRSKFDFLRISPKRAICDIIPDLLRRIVPTLKIALYLIAKTSRNFITFFLILNASFRWIKQGYRDDSSALMIMLIYRYGAHRTSFQVTRLVGRIQSVQLYETGFCCL